MFFSVKSAVKIGGKTYVPCVCYAVPDYLLPTVDKLAKEGKVYIYEKRVSFQNGMVLENKPEPEKKCTGKKEKKDRKPKEVPVQDIQDVAKEADIFPEDEGF